MAELAGQKAEATLDVATTAGHTGIVGGPGHGGIIGGGEFDPDWFLIPDWVIGGGDEEIVGVEPGVGPAVGPAVGPGVEVRPGGGYVPGVTTGPHGHSVVHAPGETPVHGAEPAIAAAAGLAITPEHVSVELGRSTPAFVASELDAAGGADEVPATLESMDPAVLKPDPKAPGRFMAVGCGRTQVRAAYQGRQAVASVEVTGQRFLGVTIEAPQRRKSGFDVGVRVQAAKSGGRIEYRIYEAGTSPPDHWVAARETADHQEAELRSPELVYGREEYHLVVEARGGSPASVTEYQLWFKLEPQIEQAR